MTGNYLGPMATHAELEAADYYSNQADADLTDHPIPDAPGDGNRRSGSSRSTPPESEPDAASLPTSGPGSLAENVEPDDGDDDGYRADLGVELGAGTNGNGQVGGADVIARDLLAEILTADQIEQLPPPEPLVDQLLMGVLGS